MAKNDLRDTTCPPPEIDPNKYGVLKRETAVVTPPFRTLTTRGMRSGRIKTATTLFLPRDEGLESWPNASSITNPRKRSQLCRQVCRTGTRPAN